MIFHKEKSRIGLLLGLHNFKAYLASLAVSNPKSYLPQIFMFPKCVS
jgi:hypothetical protein